MLIGQEWQDLGNPRVGANRDAYDVNGAACENGQVDAMLFFNA